MTTLSDQFVPYEIAMRLKELGFNELCMGRYTLGEELRKLECWRNSEVLGCAAPLWQQVEEFILKKFGVMVIITMLHEIHPEPKFLGFRSSQTDDQIFKSRPEARTAAINKALELITKEANEKRQFV